MWLNFSVILRVVNVDGILLTLLLRGIVLPWFAMLAVDHVHCSLCIEQLTHFVNAGDGLCWV